MVTAVDRLLRLVAPLVLSLWDCCIYPFPLPLSSNEIFTSCFYFAGCAFSLVSCYSRPLSAVSLCLACFAVWPTRRARQTLCALRSPYPPCPPRAALVPSARACCCPALSRHYSPFAHYALNDHESYLVGHSRFSLSCVCDRERDDRREKAMIAWRDRQEHTRDMLLLLLLLLLLV